MSGGPDAGQHRHPRFFAKNAQKHGAPGEVSQTTFHGADPSTALRASLERRPRPRGLWWLFERRSKLRLYGMGIPGKTFLMPADKTPALSQRTRQGRGTPNLTGGETRKGGSGSAQCPSLFRTGLVSTIGASSPGDCHEGDSASPCQTCTMLPGRLPHGPRTLTGTTVGRFKILARLGAGGMGEVYRAEDTRLQRTRRHQTNGSPG